MRQIQIKRFPANPLLKPNPHISWMSTNVFNPGVVIDDDGLFKMLFRAAYTEDQSMSSLGLAFSPDGTEWYALDKPVLEAAGGIEDSRIVHWNGHKYVFAAMRTGAGSRIGIWRTQNLFDFEWIGIPFDVDDRNACIIPKLIDGRIYLIHRRFPHITLCWTEDVTLSGGWQGDQILTTTDQWYRDPHGNPPHKIGLAGPPIETPDGWLVMTHVVHLNAIAGYRIYSLGLMKLNLENPTIVEYIHPSPVLYPTQDYEIMGAIKTVCFSNAIVDPGGDFLYIYWGGADTVTCGGSLAKEDLVMFY